MRDILERHGPRTPAARGVVAFLAGGFGVPGLVLALGALVNTGVVAALLVCLPSAVLTYVGYVFGSAVVRRAAEAPEPDWWDGSATGDESDAETEPIRRLQRRYADGELTTEAFERRLDRLVESDEVRRGRDTSAGVARQRDGERRRQTDSGAEADPVPRSDPVSEPGAEAGFETGSDSKRPDPDPEPDRA